MTKPLQVVVLDDICRFACHLWQYLSEGVSFGIGNLPYDDGILGSGDGSSSLPTPGGEAEVHWINVDRPQWRDALCAVWERRRGQPCCLLIDVRGSNRSAGWNYSPETVMDALKLAPGERPEILLVSSYYTGERDLPTLGLRPIFPKTWKVLEEVAKRISRRGPKAAGPPAASFGPRHILVTGAGFELAQAEGGAQGLGMLWTEDLLRKTWTRLGDYSLYGDRYPVPHFPAALEERFKARVRNLEQAAGEPDLDSYWNEALALVLEQEAERRRDEPPRTRKLAASQKEYRVREEFRQALLDHDWGHLNQALDAAEIPWLAWLSTNYTGFADRALALAENARALKRGWRIVSTSNEAVHVARQVLHGTGSAASGAAAAPILFKLHGHGEHLLTMAIAGEDKEVYSSLSLPVDSLHEVYASAKIFLKKALSERPGTTFWHIVGHSLADVLLKDLVTEVIAGQPASPSPPVVFFVGPGAEAQAPESFGSLQRGENYHPIALKARQYLARLKRAGEPPAEAKPRQRWIEEIVEGGD